MSAASTPIDATVREEIRRETGTNMCVEAGAGTGKTTSLVTRIVEILATEAATADSLVAITFTEAAAAELSARVREGLERALAAEADPDRVERLGAALRSLHRSRIETIHAFCASLLHERPVEAGVDPEFAVLADMEADLSFDQAYATWLDELLQGDHPEVERAFNLGLDLRMMRDAAETLHRFRYLLPLGQYPAPHGSVSEVLEWIDRAVPELEGIAARCLDETDKNLPYIERLVEYRRRLEIEGTTEAAQARIIATSVPSVHLRAGSKSHWDDPADLDRVRELFADWRELAERIPGALRSQALIDVLEHLSSFVETYAAARKAEGVADFDDILIWARDLLRDELAVRAYFQDRFDTILIDEFQDTDPIQVEIAMFLASDGQRSKNWRRLEPAPGKLFVVGDPKQSIYRFRRADIAIYDEVKRGKLGEGIKTIVQNFRSVAPVIDWVNRVFDELFVEREGIQPANVPLQPSAPPAKGQSPIVVIRDSSGDKLRAGELRQREALSVAAVLRDAISDDGSWLVRDRDTQELRPAIWRDVAILLPARTGLEAYEEALAAAEIPHRHEGSRDFFQRQEVRDFILLLGAIADPADRISVIGALRSAAFGCSDENLVVHRANGGILDYRVAVEGGDEQVNAAFELLRSWHRASRGLSVGELVTRALTESRMVEYTLTLPNGEQAAANLLAIPDRAREFVAAGGGGPRAFIRWLVEHSERQANEVDTGITEENDNVVRLMTMHGAKGLEYPIVVLANLSNRPRTESAPVPDEHRSLLHFRVGTGRTGHYATPAFQDRIDDEREALRSEAIRLLYVASTRARDTLIVPDLEPEPSDTSLAASLAPLIAADAAHGEIVDDVQYLDTAALDLPEPIEEKRPTKAGKGAVTNAHRDCDAWREEQAESRADARQELKLEVASGRRRDQRPLAAEASSSDATLLMSEGPPLEIGEALHLIMERVTLPSAEDLEEVTDAIAAEAGLVDHRDELVGLAARCLKSPTVVAAAGGTVLREVPFTTAGEAGFVTGRLDLVAVDGDRVVIVDYKTDAVIAEEAAIHTAEHFSGQAASYVAGLKAATGLGAQSVIFIYCRPSVEVELVAETAP